MEKVLVTGSTSGIGKETAKGLAERGMSVILHGRNEKRGKEALREIREETGNDNLDLIFADFSCFEEVRELAPQVRENHDRMDVLVNNAGTVFSERKLNEDGIELTFTVNHLAPFLLTNLILDILKDNAPSRIVNVSSGGHKGTSLDFDALTGEEGPGMWQAYKQSKLANILFTYELAERLEGTGVTVNCLHPGGVSTRLARDNSILGFIWNHLPFLRSPESGAETSIYLASSPEVEGVTGKYFVDREPERSSDYSYNEDAWERLWEVSKELTNLREEEMIPEVRSRSD